MQELAVEGCRSLDEAVADGGEFLLAHAGKRAQELVVWVRADAALFAEDGRVADCFAGALQDACAVEVDDLLEYTTGEQLGRLLRVGREYVPDFEQVVLQTFADAFIGRQPQGEALESA